MAQLLYESLHSHTVLSDGVMTHLQVLKAAERLGIGVVAFTDHDALPTADVMDGLRAYTGPVKWTIGVELSSLVPTEVGGVERGNVHILGLFPDIANPALIAFCRAAEDSRLKRMRAYVTHLRDLGFTVSEADVLGVATSKNIASPHMVKALALHSENAAVQERIKGEMWAAAQHDEVIMAKYKQTEGDGPNQWPYALFMGGHSFRPAPRTGFDVLRPYEQSVKLIREAGGVALAAHWYLEPDKVGAADIEALLASGGLDGIETEVVNVIGNRDVRREVALSRELVQKYQALEVVSSDSHSQADLEAFVVSPVAKHSVGQTARLVKRLQPNLQWSKL